MNNQPSSLQRAPLVAQQEPYPYSAGDSDPYSYDYNPTGSNRQSLTTESQDFDAQAMRQKALELARREEELNEREKSLKKKEEEVGSAAPKPNWPRCYPIVHHSIRSIQGSLRRTVAIMGYIGFFVLILIVLLNFVGAMIAVSPFISYGPTDEMGNGGRARFGFWAGLFMVATPLAHFLFSYWPLYKAMSTVHVFWFILMFVGYAIPILFCAFCFAGWYDYGPCGLILIILSFPASGRGNLTVFIVSCIMTALWALMGIYYVVIYIMALQVFRKENHTFKSARDFLKSSLVRGVSKAVTTGVTTMANTQGEQVATGSVNASV